MNRPPPVRHYIAKQEESARNVLVAHMGLTEEKADWLIDFGGVYLNKKRLLANQTIQSKDYLRVHLKPRRYPVPDLQWKARLVAEHEEFIVINKPRGLPTHPMLDNRIENCLHMFREELGYPLWVTQRLDTATEGLLVFAKTKEFQARFNKLLADNRVEKSYRVWTKNPISLGRLTHFMKPDDRAPKVVAKEEKPDWLKCELEVLGCEEVEVESKTPVYELQLKLLTGRTHQIRAQLSVEGAPVIGDKLYKGPRNKVGSSALRLQSYELAFETSKDQSHRFAVPRPDHWL